MAAKRSELFDLAVEAQIAVDAWLGMSDVPEDGRVLVRGVMACLPVACDHAEASAFARRAAMALTAAAHALAWQESPDLGRVVDATIAPVTLALHRETRR